MSLSEAHMAALNNPHFGLQLLAIADAQSTPKSGVRDYEFNDPATWGHCRWCRFIVTLDEDGFIRPHDRRTGTWTKVSCPGGRKEPETYYRAEVPE